MDVPDEGVLDVDMLGDEGSDDEGEAPQSSDFYGGPASTPTSCASSPREEPASPHGTPIQPAFFHQQQYVRPFFMSARRGPGRPRKEGVKLAKEGKIVRRYRNPGSIRGAKRHRGSRDDALEDLLDEDDFTMPAPEEPPYFPEKWPGKLCALCNLGERSQLGQGEMKQFPCILVDADGNPIPSVPSSGGATPTSTAPGTPGGGCGALGSPPPESDGQPSQNAPLSRRQKGIHKCKTPLYNMEHTDELSIIGYIEPPDLSTIVSNSLLYIHRSCLEFSPPFQDLAEVSEDDKEIIEEKRVKSIVTASLAKKCSFCQRHGASIPCKTNCNKYFHWPCVLASGGFLDFQSKIAICKDHLYQVPLVCSEDIDCRMCRVVGDVSNLMTCVTCGGHYHGTCVGLAQLPGVRAGWSCRSCRVCQVCRGEASGPSGPAGPERADPRSVTCEHCDKMYHAACLRPVMATVPKYGWKCKCCRVCSDCGARSPGAGPSSRWHAHYTVCDSCYQQRNKGSCCPLCRRAYRAAAMRDMTRCALCRRYVHGMCDPEAEPLQYRTKKDQNPSYDYHCPICKTQVINNTRTNSFESEDGNATPSHDSSFGDDLPPEQDPLALEPKTDIGLGKGKPYTVSSKVAKKKMGSYKMKGGYPATGKLGFQKRQRSGFLDFGRKRGTKPKMRGVFGVPGLGLQRPQAPDSKTADDDPGGENKLIICSSKDKFVLTQDLCVMCGAIGTDSEGCLIACSQCGQTYHPYCVNIKVSKVIVTLGWRCLDCTVCEGCGLRGDDALLVLCDDCDTAHHTYCAKPTLPEVPAGSWRCERCRRCLTCGTTETDNWCENYTECGPCASQSSCALCLSPYSEGELMIQCSPCRRWLHAACDHMRGERDADLCSRAGYSCPLCRGRDVPPPHLLRPSPARPPPTPQSLGLAGEYFVDDVCLSQKGANHMKLLEAEMGVTHTRRKRRFKNELLDPKDALVQSVDVDAGDDTKPDSTADNRDDTGLLGNTNFKEGTRWNVGTEGPPPEGFTIYTTESGVTVLRRKRQRNLNKLGIGGFVVRQRQVSSKNQPDDEMDGTMPSGAESPNNKRKPRRKTRSKLMEQYPSYMQEAFFGKDLLEPGKHVITSTGNPLESPGGTIRSVTPEGYRELRDFRLDDNSDSDADDILPALALYNRSDHTIYIALNKEEVELLNSLKPKDEKDDGFIHDLGFRIKSEDGIDDTHLKHTEDSTALRNAILGPAHPPEIEPVTVNEAIPTVHGTKVENMGSDTGRSSVASTISPKDDLSLLGVTLDAMVRDSLPDMDSNDVDEIFKGVLTDDSQESQESSVSYVTNTSLSAPYSQHSRQQLQSPMDYASPYHHTDYGTGQPQLSPAFSESSAGAAPSWPPDSQPPPPATYNQRSADKMRADESLGLAATISAVLYANTNHPEWKMEFPSWVDRCKQILKKWRALPSEQKAPYLQRARENRSAIRMKKAQQTGAQATAASPSTSSSGAGSVATSVAVVTSAATSEAEPVRAPNVTVTANGLLEADAHIRVLTPSEIMRTLPPLHATTTATSTATSTTATEQERACGPQRSAREAEQERQWKQLQQLRQQQTQQQQQIIQDQRLQVSRLSHKAALQRMRSPEGEVVGNVGEAPRSVFPAQRFPLHYANDDINRQLRDLLQRHPDKMWPPQSEDGTIAVTVDGQQFRPPLPVGLRPRLPLQPGQRPDHPMIIQHRMSLPQQSLIVSGGMPVQGQEHKLQDNTHHIGNSEDKPNTSGETSGEDITMGDMDKDEQDSGNIGEVGDILPSLSGEDDEELLESLTAEIGEEFNILEYADPELAAFNDAGHLLDGLELADDAPPERHVKRELGEIEQKFDEKIESNLQAVRNSMQNLQSTIKTEIKSELEDVKTEMEVKPSEILHPVSTIRQMYMDGVQRVITQNLSMQTQLIKSEVKLEAGEMKEEWPSVVQAPSQRFQQIPIQQRVIQQQLPMQGMGQRSAMSQLQRPQIHFANNPHALHVAQGNNQVGSPRGVVTMARGPPPKLLASDVRPGAGSVPRAPPPYPGTLRHQPPPPPYPQMDPAASWVGPGVAARWPPRPLLLQNVNQEQPLLLEELLEQEKREQERDTDWGVATVGVAPPMAVQQVGVANGTTPAVPLFTGTAPPAPPPPPERILTDADRHAHAVYEHWLQQNNVFVTDQLRHYEAEVQKLRKMRKSLNSKQRQLRKSGNELMPTDAAELQRISTEQAALQKHLEAARKQARQHGMTIQEYETKHRQPPPTPQPTQQQQQPMGQQQQLANTNQTIYVQNPNLAQARGRLLPGGRTLVIERTIPRAAPPRPPRAAMSPLHVQSPHSPLHLNSPMQQSPLHQQQSPLHQQQTQILQQQSQMHQQHQQQSQLQQSQIHQQNQMLQQQPTIIHAQQSPIHQQQSPLHQQQSPLQHQQQSQMMPQQSPMHSQQSPMHQQQSPMHQQQSPMHQQQSPMHQQQSPMHQQTQMHNQQPQQMASQQSQLHQQTAMHPQQSPIHHPQQSPIHHPQQSPIHHPQQSPIHHPQQSPIHHPQQSPIHHPQQSPLHQQSSMLPQQSPMQQSPMHSQQSPMHTQQSPMQTSMSPQHFLQQLQAQRTSPQLPPPSRSPQIYQQQQQILSPALSPAPEYSSRFPRPAPACSPASGRFPRPHMQQGMRVSFGGRQTSPLGSPQPLQSPGNPNTESMTRQQILQRGQFSPMAGAPLSPLSRSPLLARTATPSPVASPPAPPTPGLRGGEPNSVFPPKFRYRRAGLRGGAPGWPAKDRHVTKVSILKRRTPPNAEPAAEPIATEEDFERLIDNNQADEEEQPPATKTVAVISLASQNNQNVQYKILAPSSSHPNSKLINEVAQTTVASVSIANQTISVPVFKNLNVPLGEHSGAKKVPLNLSNQSLNLYVQNPQMSKPMSSVISVISSNIPKMAGLSPVITLATSNTVATPTRVPVSMFSQQQVKQKIVKTIEKPIGLSLSNTKLSSLSVSHDTTLPAKIFQDEAASPDSTVTSESSDKLSQPGPSQVEPMQITEDKLVPKKDIDIESEISQQTELPHTLCMTERQPLMLGKTDIKSPDPVPEKIPDNIMEGDDDDKPEDMISNQQNIMLPFIKPQSTQLPPPHPSHSEQSQVDVNVVQTIKAIANQTKDMVIDSNMQITSELAQESVQISIPSPTPSQEQYLNHITMQQHTETGEGSEKHVGLYHDMLHMLENISDDPKQYPGKQLPKPNLAPPKPEHKDLQDNKPPSYINKPREHENINQNIIQAATVPQLSPLSQPTELTTNMANVSQQLRTIMSSLNTTKVETTTNLALRKPNDSSPLQQVNFENFLPSSKVEVVNVVRPQPILKPGTVMMNPEAMPMNAAQLLGSRVNTLSSMSQTRKSPNASPINSPVMQGNLIKSPAQSPLIANPGNQSEEMPTITSCPTSQIIQMPALSTIHRSSGPQTVLHTNSGITTMSNIHKNQTLPTSILSNTLLQPNRQMTTNVTFHQQSSSQPPALVMTSRPVVSGNKMESPPNVTLRTHNILNTGLSQMQGLAQASKQTGSINFISSSTLLHTQLTSPLKRSKSTDEPKSEVIVGHIQPTKRHSVESVIVKSEPMETDDMTAGTAGDACKLLQQSTTQKNDESQNVLLKQLLQTTTATTTVIPPRSVSLQRTAPALGTIPSLEAQLARPVIPPPTLPLSQEIEIPKSSPRPITSQNPTFINRPTQITVPTASMSPLIQTSTQSLMDVRKQPTPKLMETTPLPETSPTMKSVQMYSMNIDQQIIKKEITPPLQSPVHRPITPMDVKKELIDESSQQSAASGVSTASDQGKLDHPIKEEFPENVGLDAGSEVMAPETPSEAKKRKRREYQQKKRKQMQMNMKAAAEINTNAANAKKRPRKGSRFEEDYDTYIDNLMSQLRILPPMQIQEPALTTNFAVCPLFGSGDLTKLKNKDYDILKGDLVGEFGNARIPNVADYYNTKPFGEEEPLPEKPAASTQRGFYDQEFQPIVFDDDPEDKKLEFICKERDTDTPDSIVSCSSDECYEIEPPNRFPGIKLTDDDDDEEDGDSPVSGRMSPVVPLIAPVPIRLKPVLLYQVKDEEDVKPRPMEIDLPLKPRVNSPGNNDVNENVTVTLTLTSGAAEDIMGVLKELAGILHIPPPTSYQIVERTATPPSHKLGLYRSKGRDGKEGTPIDIQSILNGAAKFCRHCDVVILDSVVRAKASEFPLLSGNGGMVTDGDTELYFCGTQCYERFSWRPTDLSKEERMDTDVGDCDTASAESADEKAESPGSLAGVKYKRYSGRVKPVARGKRTSDRELAELVFRYGAAVRPVGQDVRRCELCGLQGDGVADGVARLLNCDADRWVHLNCALWSDGVYETVSGALVNVDSALAAAAANACAACRRLGATVRCFKLRCGSVYHLGCAVKDNCVFYKNKTAYCASHAPKGEKDNELTTLSVQRRVYISRDEQRQVASVMLHCDTNHLLRIGGLIFLSPGHLLPHQLAAFHTPNYIYPIGYKIVRFYWSWRRANSRSRYVCWISEHEGRPRFHVQPQDEPQHETHASTARAAWEQILDAVSELRGGAAGGTPERAGVLRLWPQYITGEDLFGLTEPSVVRVLESLPGIETLSDYRFKFGRSALLEGGLAVNPSGCARAEPRARTHWRRALVPAPAPLDHAPNTPHSTSHATHGAQHSACPYTKQFVHTKSSQYKKMKMEWRHNVYLARSKIQGLGLYAARDIEKHTMVIEYIGELIRSELSEIREKQYEAKNRGIYMFRLDERRVVDATLCGGLARYINHSCQPNCVAETVEVDRQLRIIIFAKRRIARGEELAYDYKFDIEDDANKIMCMCGAPNCRKWMN